MVLEVHCHHVAGISLVGVPFAKANNTLVIVWEDIESSKAEAHVSTRISGKIPCVISTNISICHFTINSFVIYEVSELVIRIHSDVTGAILIEPSIS